MTRKKKVKEQEIVVRQDVVQGSQAVGQSFDLMLRFTDNALQPELYMDELVKLIIEGLIENYGEIVVKVNWFAEGLQVIVPTKLPAEDFLNAPQGPQEAPTATID